MSTPKNMPFESSADDGLVSAASEEHLTVFKFITPEDELLVIHSRLLFSLPFLIDLVPFSATQKQLLGTVLSKHGSGCRMHSFP
jgi:hypothetical protein